MSEPLRTDVLGTLLPGFVGTVLPEWLGALLREGLGGVCLFGQNIVDRDQTAALTDAILAANPGAVIAIDEEGGDVTRLYYATGAPYPGNALLGRIGELALTERTAHAVGVQLRDVGVNVTFAPDADINSNPDNPVIGIRSFGTDAEQVADHTAAWVSAVQAVGVGASAKHFPGHGDTAADSHLGVPVIDRSLEELRERELVPFRAAIAAGTATIMTSHILVPQLDPVNPATMSPAILQGVLRGELGFEGVIVSDALDMKGASGELGIPGAAAKALAAGVDLLCIGTENTAEQLGQIVARVAAAVAAGELSAERVAEAADRVRELTGALAAVRATVAVPADGAPEPQYQLARIASGFDIALTARDWIAAAAAGFRIVRIESENNIAVGIAPWGPFAAGAREDVRVDAESTEASAALAAAVAGPEPVAIIGKDLHRRAGAVALIDAARAARGASVLVVDMGWPGDDRAYADIATFGASRLVGEALLALLGAAA